MRAICLRALQNRNTTELEVIHPRSGVWMGEADRAAALQLRIAVCGAQGGWTLRGLPTERPEQWNTCSGRCGGVSFRGDLSIHLHHLGLPDEVGKNRC